MRGLIRERDAHGLCPGLAFEHQRLALGRIKLRSLAGINGNRHAGGRQTVHFVVAEYIGQRQGELACVALAQKEANGAFRSDGEADALQGPNG
jgi:hypothetical protein